MYPLSRVGGFQVWNQMPLYCGYRFLTLSTSVIAEGKPIANPERNKTGNEELYGFNLCNFFLRECINMKSLSQGKMVHSHIVKCNLEEDMFFQNNLVNMYGKCGSVENARKVFDRMPERNVYSWTLMIGEYVHHGYCEEALNLFTQMKQEAGLKLSHFTVVSVVRACAKIAGFPYGKLVHAHVIKIGFQSDVMVGTALVDMYAKTGNIEHARQVFDKMPEKNVFSWTVVISEYAKHGHCEEVFKLFKGLLCAGVKPNHFTFSSVLSVGSMLDSLEQGKQVHAHIIKTGFESFLFVGNALVDMYVQWGNMADSNTVFNNMPELDVVSWTGLISGYANNAENGYGKKALELFSQMTWSGMKPDNDILALVLKACACIAFLESGQELHAYVIKSGYEANASVVNTLVDMYSKCGCIQDACKVFDEMEEPNLIACNAMIAGYTRHGLEEDALKLFLEMRQLRMIPNGFTFVSAVTACANLAAQEQGKHIHADIVKSGFAFDLFVGNALVGMYAKCGSMKDATLVFDRIITWDVVSWNSMIGGYAQHNCGVEAFQYLAEMLRFGINPSQVTFVSILKACARLPSGENGKQVHACIIKMCLETNIFVGSALVDMYANCSNIEDAIKLFDKMPKRDVVSWNAMMGGFFHSQNGDKALELYLEMLWAGIKSNQSTFVNVISVCTGLAAVEQGKHFHSHIIKTGFESDVILGSALVDMYAKCGCIEDAQKVFNKLINRDLISWNAMITGYANHGLVKNVFQLFQQMEHAGMQLNHITFIALLSACGHAGLVDEAFKYIDLMSQAYGILPGLDHHACLVDLLGRAGHLNEAHNYIHEKSLQLNSVIWQSLLAACRVYGNIQLGEQAAKCILELEPQDVTTYILLSNIYAAAGRWDDVNRVRKIMKDVGLKKKPGFSWIEVKNKVHTFVVGDRSHPQTEEIYAELQRLKGLMKEAGHVPDAQVLLHDKEQERVEMIAI